MDEFNEQNRRLSDSRRFSGEDFLQRTAGKPRRKLKFWDMGFFQKIPIYHICEELLKKVNGLGDFRGALDTFFISAPNYEI